MKRALKIVLLSVGAVAGIVGLFFWDTISRADAAIRDEEERIARDIAAARSRRPAGHPIFPFEDGHAGAKSASRWSAATTIVKEPWTETAEQVIADLEVLQDRLGEGGYQAQFFRGTGEMRCLVRLLDLLKAGQDLRPLAEQLHRIEKNRPSLRDIVDGEHLLDRVEVIRVLRRKEDPTCMILRPPGWREAFSWRVHIAKILRELDDHYRDAQDLPPVRTRSNLLLRSSRVTEFETTLMEDWRRIGIRIGSK